MPTAEEIRVKLKLVSIARRRMGNPVNAIYSDKPKYEPDKNFYGDLQEGQDPSVGESMAGGLDSFASGVANMATLGATGTPDPKSRFGRAEAQHPIANVVGQFAGAMLPFGAAEGAVAKAIPKIAGETLLPRVARGAIAGTAVQAAQEGVQGDITPESLGTGAALGAVADAVLPPAFKLLGKGARRIAGMFSKAQTGAMKRSVVNNFVKAAAEDGVTVSKEEAENILSTKADEIASPQPEQAGATSVGDQQINVRDVSSQKATPSTPPVDDLKAQIDAIVPKDVENRLSKERKSSLPPVSEPQAGKSENLPAQETSTTPPVEKTSTQPADAGGAGSPGKSAIDAESAPASASEGGAEPDAIGLNKDQIEKIRKATGLDELPDFERRSHLSVLNKAKENGTDRRAMDIAKEIKENPRPLSDEEHAGMVLKIEELHNAFKESVEAVDDAISKGADTAALQARTKVIEDEINLLTDASDSGGRESARGLNARRMLKSLQTDDIVYVRRQATAKKGSKLTEQESAHFEKIVAEKDAALKRLDEENAKWQKDYEDLQKKQADELVRRESNKAKITERSQTKREKIISDRIDILKKLKERGHEVTLNAGVNPEDAYLIGKLAINYVKQGTNDIDEVVRLVMADIPNLTKRDVWQSINSKNPDLQAKAKTEVMRKVNAIKRQAELLTKIEDAEAGIFNTTRKNLSTPAEIKALQARLRELRLKSFETVRNADRLERTQKAISDAQNQLNNHYRKVKKAKPVDTPEIVAAKEKLTALRKQMAAEDKPAQARIQKQIDDVQAQLDGHYRNLKKRVAPETEDITNLRNSLKELRRTMKIEDELARYEDQLRTGDFEVPAEVVKRKVSPTLERAEIDLKKARRKIRDEIENLRPKGKVEKAVAVAENLRAIKATADLSATLRQGAVSVVSHPVLALKNFPKALGAAFSEFKAEALDNAMKEGANKYLYDKGKLELAELSGLPTKREEYFAGAVVEKIPGLGQVVKASNRHMATFLNLMRTGMFDDFVKKVPNATSEELQAYAKWINVTTGRGDLGKFAQAGRTLGTVFFAPRFAVSRLQTPVVFFKSMKSSPRVRAQVAKEAVAVTSTALGVLALAKLSGATVGDNPRESDFGKIRIGDERIDIFAGYQQPYRLIAKAAVGATDRMGLTGDWLRNEKTGEINANTEVDPIDDWIQFATFKLSPQVQLARQLYTGNDVIGNDQSRVETVIRSVVPIMAETIYDAWEQEGAGTAARSAGLNLLGVSSNVYPDSPARLKRDIKKAEFEGDKNLIQIKKDELKQTEKKKKDEKVAIR